MIKVKDGVAQVDQKDYLGPHKRGNRGLVEDAERHRKAGLVVNIWSPAGFIIATGYPGNAEKPWSRFEYTKEKKFHSLWPILRGK